MPRRLTTNHANERVLGLIDNLGVLDWFEIRQASHEADASPEPMKRLLPWRREVARRWQTSLKAHRTHGAAPLESGEIQGCDGLSREGVGLLSLPGKSLTQASGAIHWQGLLVYWAPFQGLNLRKAAVLIK